MYLKIVGISFLLIFLQHFARVMYILDFHVTIHNHKPGPCHAVPGVEQGAEDMETLPDGITFITSGFQWSVGPSHFAQLYKDQRRQGKILLFDFNKPKNGVTELKFDKHFDQSTFFPHGISVWQNEQTGTIYLFVVNHSPERDQIEKFEFHKDQMLLEHKITYADESIILANDIAATGENSFYFTNYAYSRTPLGYLIETFLLFPWGSVVYFNGDTYQEVADGLLNPNGILLSKDKKTVYVANGLQKSLIIFSREEDDHLSIIQEFQLYSSPDNFLIEPKSGNLLTCAHPIIHETVAHLEAPDLHRAPSQVLMIHLKNSSYADGITELFCDQGNLISGGSVAAVYDNQMLIGSVVDKLVYCEVRTLE